MIETTQIIVGEIHVAYPIIFKESYKTENGLPTAVQVDS